MQFPDFGGEYGRGCRPTQPFSVLPSMGQSGPRSFPQDFPFELGEDRQQSSHGATRRCGQIQCLGQRNEANTEMLQFLKRGEKVSDRMKWAP